MKSTLHSLFALREGPQIPLLPSEGTVCTLGQESAGTHGLKQTCHFIIMDECGHNTPNSLCSKDPLPPRARIHGGSPPTFSDKKGENKAQIAGNQLYIVKIRGGNQTPWQPSRGAQFTTIFLAIWG